MKTKIVLLVSLVVIIFNDVKGSIELEVPNPAFDESLYEDVLDPELCHEQVRLIRSNSLLRLFFADAGPRIPRGILQGNTLDLGNYHQCIGFNQPFPEYDLQGKYCMIRVPLEQNYEWPDWGLPGLPDFGLDVQSELNATIDTIDKYNMKRKGMLAMTGIVENERLLPGSPLSSTEFRMAVCIPKPCSTEQAITSLLFNVSQIGFRYTDEFCRISGDKPYTPGDYVTLGLFCLLGLITVISTAYDVWHTVILKEDPKSVSMIKRSFSMYTNGRRLMTFNSGSDTVECLDGIRALAMSWVLLGHEFTSEPFWANPIDTFMWSSSWKSLWVVGAHATVDTFFMLSGFLVVYTTVGKLSGSRLLKNLHLFYLNRLLRMFPLLAVAVLLEATYFNHMTDGPIWGMANQVQSCRTNWWSTLLHLQNYLTPRMACIGQSWYLAIDTQLHILSPIILFWVLSGKQRRAWIVLLTGLCGILIASTVYNFVMEFPSTMIAPGREDEMMYYLVNYYVNTLTRASPFLVGMVFGYLVRVVKLDMTKIQTLVYWMVTFSLSTFIMYTNYPISQQGWDNQLADSLFNSFIRPLWALFVGCIIWACVYGYAGPINWFLSLRVWKLHARISYAMYLFHYGIMFAINSSAVTPPRFTVASVTFKFLAHYVLCMFVSIFLTLLVDSPFSVIFKLMMGGGVKRPVKKEIDEEPIKDTNKQV